MLLERAKAPEVSKSVVDAEYFVRVGCERRVERGPTNRRSSTSLCSCGDCLGKYGLQDRKRVLLEAKQRSTSPKHRGCRWGWTGGWDLRTPRNFVREFYATVERWRPSKHRHLMAFPYLPGALIGRTEIRTANGGKGLAVIFIGGVECHTVVCHAYHSARTNGRHLANPPVA